MYIRATAPWLRLGLGFRFWMSTATSHVQFPTFPCSLMKLTHVKSGDGGNGCISFLARSTFPKGGARRRRRGNAAWMSSSIADEELNTLFDFRGQHHGNAPSGEAGRGKQQYGLAVRSDIRVPGDAGVNDKGTRELIVVSAPWGELHDREGRKGGYVIFTTPSRPRTMRPKTAGAGQSGEHRHHPLELKLIAEVGIVGLPNVGQDHAAGAISDVPARISPTIPVHFTTLGRSSGRRAGPASTRLVFADSRLIEGAALGGGPGPHEFLLPPPHRADRFPRAPHRHRPSRRHDLTPPPLPDDPRRTRQALRALAESPR